MTTLKMIERWKDSDFKLEFVGKRDLFEVVVGSKSANGYGTNPNLVFLDNEKEPFVITEYTLGYEWEEVKPKINEIYNMKDVITKILNRLEEIEKEVIE